jgi:5-formyltetrahydrofolate cyclo-ligase
MLKKSEIRKIFQHKRNQLEKKQVQNLSFKFYKHFLHNLTKLELIKKSGQNIAGYFPFGNELDILHCLKTLKQMGNVILLPTVIDKNKPMIFRVWDCHVNSLVENKFYKEIKEPSIDCKQLIPDIILAPAIAVDLYKNRIGQGAGFYDRTLIELKKINANLKTICIVFDFQIVDKKIPMEKFDYKFDYVLSELRLL